MTRLPDRMALSQTSEIGPLKAVLLHRPGEELENLTPAYLNDLLFDEIPWLRGARREHDGFAQALRQRGVEVLYILDLIAEVLQDESLRARFVDEHLKFSNLFDPEIRKLARDLLLSQTPQELAQRLITGIPKHVLKRERPVTTLRDLTSKAYPFYLDPMPSMYFTRDHGAVIGDRMLISQMANFARRRETLFLRYIAAYHPRFRGEESAVWFEKELPTGIEGGDVLVLSPEVLCIGFSERTTEAAIEYVAHGLFHKRHELREILVVEIPATRTFMHLDTVFTMVDQDKFLLYPGIRFDLRVYSLFLAGEGQVGAREEESLERALERALGLKSVEIIHSGGEDPIAQAREQWGDSTNTLAIAPGVVITYDRNEETNRTLRRHGIEVVEIEGSELVRGRGGPRCMSFPLRREPLG